MELSENLIIPFFTFVAFVASSIHSMRFCCHLALNDSAHRNELLGDPPMQKGWQAADEAGAKNQSEMTAKAPEARCPGGMALVTNSMPNVTYKEGAVHNIESFSEYIK